MLFYWDATKSLTSAETTACPIVHSASLPPHTLNSSSSPCTPSVGSLGLNLAQPQCSQGWCRLGDTGHNISHVPLPSPGKRKGATILFPREGCGLLSPQELPCTPGRDKAGVVQVLSFVCPSPDCRPSRAGAQTWLAGNQFNYPHLYLGNFTTSNVKSCFLISHAHQRKNHIANKHKQNHHSMRLY